VSSKNRKRRRSSRNGASEKRRTQPSGQSEASARPNMLWAWVAGALVAGGLSVLSWLLPASPSSVPISASVHRSGNVSLLLAGAPSKATSPVCGCVHHDPPGGWRGIVLPAQELTVTRRDHEVGGGTQYDIFSSAPQQIGAIPVEFGMSNSVAVIAVRPKDVGVDPLSLPHRDVLVGYPSEEERDDWISVIASGPLHIRSASTEPVAALSPPEGRWATISYSEPDDTSASEALAITTSVNREVATKHPREGSDAFPILDVLGPSITMWAPVENVKYPEVVSAWGSPMPATPGLAFSAPADEWPLEVPTAPRGWVREIVIRTDSPLFAARLTMRPARLDQPPTLEGATGSGYGTFEVSAPHVIQHADALVRAFARAEKHPTFWINGMPTIPNTSDATSRPTGGQAGKAQYDPARFEFEYPPTPPLAGVNVFGNISDLQFSNATADLTIGTTSQSIGALTPLALRHIHGSGVVGRHMVIPVRVDGSGAQIHVIGDADARINGVPVAQRRPWLVRVLSKEDVAWFFAIVGGMALAQGVRLRWPVMARSSTRRARSRKL
jgi:hypothetical protein